MEDAYQLGAPGSLPQRSVRRHCRTEARLRDPAAAHPGSGCCQAFLNSPPFWSPLHACMGRKKWLSADREDPHSPVPIDKMHEPRYPPLMKQLITAKLKLHTTPAQFQALRATQLAYRDSLNFVSQYAFAHGKMSNRVALQDGTYDDIRSRFHLPSQMACSVPRQVGATYKTLWTKVRQNTAARRAGTTK